MTWGTAIILVVLAAIVFLIVRTMLRNKAQGKTTCGCGCANCAAAGTCHFASNKNNKRAKA